MPIIKYLLWAFLFGVFICSWIVPVVSMTYLYLKEGRISYLKLVSWKQEQGVSELENKLIRICHFFEEISKWCIGSLAILVLIIVIMKFY
ncbi:oligosaccharyl transferase [Gallionella capsiferriformans ES-2]|uniref:Oligosaccharyl transferase n=1 Tax=Gallionella capsiferriformans (strain ES-2) TaxID=395494 RepID=D9SG10_GALCS|nr:oligosaccharyl transferase [Gallionella capsiferriformans ES-2]